MALEVSPNAGKDITIDLSDDVDDVQVNCLRYCTNRDEIHATVVEAFVRVDAPLVIQVCRRNDVRQKRRSSHAAPFGYTGSKVAASVNLKVNTSASEAGGFDLTSSSFLGPRVPAIKAKRWCGSE